MHKKFSHTLVGLVIVSIMLAAAGCGQLPTVELPTEEPTPVPPTPTEVAYSMPEGPYPPTVVSYTPLSGAEVTTDTEVILRFNQPMNRESVATALRISPEVQGEGEWENSRTFIYKPKTLASATRYRVLVEPTAQSEEGVPLSTELAFAFSTLSPLEVTRVDPPDGAADLRADTPLMIAFNRAMVPINCTGQSAQENTSCAPLPLNIEPRVLGSGEWLNTSLYRFTPLTGWGAGESYTIILEDTTSVGGAPLAKAETWTFSTAQPRIVEVSPRDGAKGVLLDTAVRVTFNTPMDPEVTGSAFSLVTEAGSPIPGAITWQDNNAALIFTPTQQLALGTRYTFRVHERARAVTSAPLQDSGAWSFTTAPSPSVVSFAPFPGAEGIGVNEPMRVTFEGAIDPRTLEEHVEIITDEEIEEIQDLYTYFDKETGVYRLSWEKEPQTEYCVSVGTDVADIYGNTLDESRIACFTTGDLPSFIGAATVMDAVTLDAAEPAEIYFLVRNLTDATFGLTQLSEANFIKTWETGGPSIREWTERFDPPDNVAAVTPVELVRGGDPLPTGYYALEWQSDEVQQSWQRQLKIAVIDRHVTLKLAAEEALVWVTDLRTGQPVTRTAVELMDEEDVLIAAGTTDRDGLARIPLSHRENLWERVTAVVGEPGSPGFGVALTGWNADVSPWDFDITLDASAAPEHNIALSTDRPLYRPGQSVNFKGILRQDDDAQYALPAPETRVTVSARDARWTEFYSETLPLSEMGTFDSRFPLPDDAPIGRYLLQANLAEPGDAPTEPKPQGQWTLDFDVAEYRKPDIEVTVTSEFDEVLRGEAIQALMDAAYFFGEPVSRADLHWTISAEPHAFAADVAGRWQWGQHLSPGSESQIVAEGKAQTDANGRFLISTPANLAPLSADEANGASGENDEITSQRWTIEATIVDESGFPVSGRDEVVVHAANFYLGLRPQSWVFQADDTAEINVQAVDWESAPVAEQDIAVTLARRAWYRVPAEQPFEQPTWGYTDTIISTIDVTTDAEGQALAELTPPHSGAYVVIAEATDARDNPVKAETSIWVGGAEAGQWQMAEGRIRPVADADSYEVGDTAQILLPTPFILEESLGEDEDSDEDLEKGSYEVLMTVERSGILQAQRLTFDEPNPLIELPIDASYVPNVFVSFIAVRGADETHPTPDVRAGYVKLAVAPTEKILTVEVAPDRTTAGPGEDVTLTVRTTDAAGQTVDAEVELAVIDKALLALSESNVPPLLETFYGERPLRVQSGDALLMLFNRMTEQLEEQADRMIAEMTLGGLGGGGGEAMMADVRQEFPDTALWRARLRTGEAGRADVTFKLPDSLTTWVAQARAATADTKVGAGETEIIVAKPLLVRPMTPRFFVIGDRPEVAAVVHNNTGEDLDITVRLSTTTGIEIEGEAEQTIAVAQGARARVAWPLYISAATGDEVVLTFAANGGGYQDATRPGIDQGGALPVYRYTSPDVMGTGGVLEEAATRLETVIIPEGASDASTLKLQLTPSLAAAMVDSLRALEQYPYATTDVFVSRILANLATYRAWQTLDVADSEMIAAMEASEAMEAMEGLIIDALDRLYSRQNADGGWGWQRDWSNLHLTSYTALTLVEAQRAGFTIREEALDRALSYIEETLAQGLQNTEVRPHYALALYALTEAERSWPRDAGANLYVGREQLGSAGRAYLALAMGIVDPSDSRVTTLLEELRGAAFVTATGAHWEEADADEWQTNTQATSVALLALGRLTPDDPLLPQIARWLMIARRGDRWETTYETAWAVLALTDYLVATDELAASYPWGVALNGRPLASGEMTADTLLASRQLQAGINDGAGLSIDQTNVLEISRDEGPGRLYYTAHLNLVRPAERVTAEDRGIVIQREYCKPPSATTATEALHQPRPCEPLEEEIRVGDTIEVRLTLVLPEQRYFLLVEDPYPGGMEPVDVTLETEAQTGPPREPGAEQVASSRWWQNPFDHRELRDERAVFFGRALSPGTYQITYALRAAIPGDYKLLPATASEMYLPEVWGRSAGGSLNVLPANP
ncbi:MAG: Ig-like domain-containing protein [Anaerolineales bacterium]